MKHIHLWGKSRSWRCFFLTDIVIDCLMLDCAAKGFAIKTMKLNLKVYVKWMIDTGEY